MFGQCFPPVWLKPLSAFWASFVSKIWGTIFAACSSLQLVRTCQCQYFTRISPGLACRCAHKSQLHADVITKHQQGARKAATFSVNPLTESRLAVDCRQLTPVCVTCGHFTSFSLTRKGLYTANFYVYGHFCRHGAEYTRM